MKNFLQLLSFFFAFIILMQHRKFVTLAVSNVKLSYDSMLEFFLLHDENNFDLKRSTIQEISFADLDITPTLILINNHLIFSSKSLIKIKIVKAVISS